MAHLDSRLIIGVTSLHGDEAWLTRNTQHYLATLAAHQAQAVVLSPDVPATLPSGQQFIPDALGRLDPAILDHLHGLVLSGGGDIDPAYFDAELNGAEVDRIDRRRDELELGLAKAALARDMPVFGICRGCQVLNVAAGGSMIQHFDGHRSPKNQTAYHDIIVNSDSRFHRIVAADQFAVNTFHHQGMDRNTLAPLFQPAAVAHPDTWLIEAFESPTHQWVIGVQWHPERIFELTEPHHRLWPSFLAACAARATQHTSAVP